MVKWQHFTLLTLLCLLPCAGGAQEVTATDAASTPASAEEKSAEDEGMMHALRSAYTSNPALKAAREGQAALEAQIGFARANFQPSITAQASYGRERTKRTGAWTYKNPSSKALSLSQPLFRGGQSLSEWQSAKERVAAGAAELVGTEQHVLLSAAAAYLDVLEKQSILALAQQNVNVLRSHQEVTTARATVGELTRTDMAQAEARLKQAEAELRQVEGELKSAHAAFARVIGHVPDRLLPDAAIPALPPTLDDAKQAAGNAPDVIAATLLEAARDAEVYGAYGALLPTVSLDGSLSRSKGNSFFGGAFDDDSLMLNVRIPLYQSGAEIARIEEAESHARKAQYTTMDTKLSAIENATKAYEEYQSSLAVIDATKAAIIAAGSARDGVQQEHEFGTRTALDLLDAEQELFSANVRLLRAQHASTLAAYRLLATTGTLTASYLGL